MNDLDSAIRIQQETKEYYEELKAGSRKPEMRNLLSLLAASEVEHRERLHSLESANAPEESQSGEAASSSKPLLTGRELLQTAEGDPDLDRFTLGDEEQGIQADEELAALTRDQATSAALAMMAEEERRHLEEVETTAYAFAEEPESHLDWDEFNDRREP